MNPPIPTTLDDALSPAWLSAALGTCYPGIEITGVTPGPVVSRISTNARFRIECAGGLPEGLPPDLCVKGYYGELGRSAVRAGIPEAAFYRDVAPTAGARTLRAHYVDFDEDTCDNVVVTEDVVAQGAEFLDPTSPYGPDKVALALEELAKLHASTWMQPGAQSSKWLAPRLETLLEMPVEIIRNNLTGPNGTNVPAGAQDADRLVATNRALIQAAASSPVWCVIHGDTHVGNLFLDADRRPAFMDWQLVQRGPWYLDVGYHIGSALTVEDRRRTEDDLVRHYLDHLAAAGVTLPAGLDLQAAINWGFVHGMYLWGITRIVEPRIIAILLERLGTAVDDHGVLAAI